ncbi:MAG: sn-glycerol-1-phosphate dehydrogenase [Tannerella sp.]|nr:sn-glycerol-1-phosphate dehydrogenase [Tannerella sp.]
MTIKEALNSASDTKALIIGAGSLAQAAQQFREQFGDGSKALIVADNNTWRVAGKEVSERFRTAGIIQDEPFIFDYPELHAEYKHIDALTEALKKTVAIPVAVGSGTINDLVKLSSHLTGKRYMCVATAASVDGYTSFGASITYNGAKQTFECPAPQACLADTNVIGLAPADMTAAGYADLFSKITGGADWILADRLGEDPIDSTSWHIVQDSLHDALADPEGVRKGDTKATAALIEGLMMSGFAMQSLRSSRPASGAEHYFSHLWDMEHHRFKGEYVSHGFQVSIGTLTVLGLYEQFLKSSFENIDIEAVCNNHPTLEDVEKKVVNLFKDSDFLDRCLSETRAKYVTRKRLAEQLHLLVDQAPEIRASLGKQLIDLQTARERLQLVGAPVDPEQIGITHERLHHTIIKAPYIRNRFTILDLGVRIGGIGVSG